MQKIASKISAQKAWFPPSITVTSAIIDSAPNSDCALKRVPAQNIPTAPLTVSAAITALAQISAAFLFFVPFAVPTLCDSALIIIAP